MVGADFFKRHFVICGHIGKHNSGVSKGGGQHNTLILILLRLCHMLKGSFLCLFYIGCFCFHCLCTTTKATRWRTTRYHFTVILRRWSVRIEGKFMTAWILPQVAFNGMARHKCVKLFKSNSAILVCFIDRYVFSYFTILNTLY